jgi:hypothetical protein
MHVVGEIPIGVRVLRRQTMGVHRGMGGPRMDLGQREILVDENDAIAVFLQQVGKQGLVHPGAERAFEVVVVDRHDFGLAVAAGRTALDIDLLHDLGERVFAKVEFGHAEQRLAILGQKKIVGLLLSPPSKVMVKAS